MRNVVPATTNRDASRYDGLARGTSPTGEKVEEQLQHAQKMECDRQLAGGIAHDFNNILTAMIGYGSVMKMDMKTAILRESISTISSPAANRRGVCLKRLLSAESRRAT